MITAGLLWLLSTLFARHFIKDLGTGITEEFRHLAGRVSALGFLLFVYLIIHKEALGFIVWLVSPEGEQGRIAEYAQNSQPVMIWAAAATFVFNLALLGVLGVAGEKK